MEMKDERDLYFHARYFIRRHGLMKTFIQMTHVKKSPAFLTLRWLQMHSSSSTWALISAFHLSIRKTIQLVPINHTTHIFIFLFSIFKRPLKGRPTVDVVRLNPWAGQDSILTCSRVTNHLVLEIARVVMATDCRNNNNTSEIKVR